MSAPPNQATISSSRRPPPRASSRAGGVPGSPERKRSALDWMAVTAEEHGREILEVYLQAMRKGDWRAAEALMSRIYGKPEAILVPRAARTPQQLCSSP